MNSLREDERLPEDIKSPKINKENAAGSSVSQGNDFETKCVPSPTSPAWSRMDSDVSKRLFAVGERLSVAVMFNLWPNSSVILFAEEPRMFPAIRLIDPVNTGFSMDRMWFY